MTTATRSCRGRLSTTPANLGPSPPPCGLLVAIFADGRSVLASVASRGRQLGASDPASLIAPKQRRGTSVAPQNGPQTCRRLADDDETEGQHSCCS